MELCLCCNLTNLLILLKFYFTLFISKWVIYSIMVSTVLYLIDFITNLFMLVLSSSCQLKNDILLWHLIVIYFYN